MKLVKKPVCDKDGAGSATVRPEEPEDMWHAYNLIMVGDRVRTTTFRKVVREGTTGSTSSQKIRLNLTIEVQGVEFDEGKCVLRLKGKNVEESAHVKMGAYHTLALEMNKNFTLEKACWDAVALERLQMACDVATSADVAALVMSQGLAHLCLVTQHMTVTKARIELNIPRKRPGASGHEKALSRFYEMVLQAILRHVDFKVVKCVLLGSPGFVKEDFYKYMTEEAVKRDLKTISENKSKFVLVHSSSGHKHALTEILTQQSVQSKLADTKAAEDVRSLEDFFEMLHTDPDKAYYGFDHVSKADEQLAVESLLISDAQFRHPDFSARRRFVDLVESVRDHGGNVRIFSSLHSSGEQLDQVSGVAAILRFPLPGLEEEIEQMMEEQKQMEQAKTSLAQKA